VDSLPNTPPAPARLGHRPLSFAALLAAGEAGQASPALYQDWLARRRTQPDLHVAWFNLGTELTHAGRRSAATLAYRKALALAPSFAPAALNLAGLLQAAGQRAEVAAVLDGALQPDEARTALINQRARLLERMKRLDEAEGELRRSLLIRPDQPDAIQHWVHVRQKLCRWPVLSDEIPGLSRETLLLNSGPLTALALIDDVAQQRQIAQRWIARKTTRPPERLSPPGGYGHARLRIGYISSDFCQHAMSMLIAELLERHDRSRFEVHGYCSSPEDGSETRRRVIAAFDRFTRIKDLSDEAAARRIRADEIDILIDLNGLTAGGRLQALRWKPAPIQATYLGFIGPVPLPELDAMFCDAFVVPPAIAPAYQPSPFYVGDIYQANDTRREAPPPHTRAEAGLPEDKFVFCCFSNHYKITEEMFAGWMQILRRAGNSVLWLTTDNEWSPVALRRAASAAGVDPERVIFSSRVSPQDYMARLGCADLFLDTYPYNAGTIASDAIRMRLPLLTLVGKSFASRMAARLLTALGANAGVTTSLHDYVETAVGMVLDRDRYEAYRTTFSAQAWHETVGNIADFTEAFDGSLLGLAKRILRL
jgi:predicted O-linked N-acetylglucosamine transferase (SPINDLY family)